MNSYNIWNCRKIKINPPDGCFVYAYFLFIGKTPCNPTTIVDFLNKRNPLQELPAEEKRLAIFIFKFNFTPVAVATVIFHFGVGSVRHRRIGHISHLILCLFHFCLIFLAHFLTPLLVCARIFGLCKNIWNVKLKNCNEARSRKTVHSIDFSL